MKKDKYFKVYIQDNYQHKYIEVNCEVVCKISNLSQPRAYIFRDIISQKLIFPNYGHSSLEVEKTLTYNNHDRQSFRRISSRDVLEFLKKIDINYIEEHQNHLDKLENKAFEKYGARNLSLEPRHLQQ